MDAILVWTIVAVAGLLLIRRFFAQFRSGSGRCCGNACAGCRLRLEEKGGYSAMKKKDASGCLSIPKPLQEELKNRAFPAIP